jgi:hypothetical protein
MSNDQRKRRFVDPDVQGALYRRLLLHWVIFLVAGAALALLMQFLLDPFTSLSVHLRKTWWTQGPFLLVGFCLMPVFIMDTIKLSHRFAGPLLRMRNVMIEAGKGAHVPPVQLRPGDFWHDFAADFNVMVERLNKYQPATKSETTRK